VLPLLHLHAAADHPDARGQAAQRWCCDCAADAFDEVHETSMKPGMVQFASILSVSPSFVHKSVHKSQAGTRLPNSNGAAVSSGDRCGLGQHAMPTYTVMPVMVVTGCWPRGRRCRCANTSSVTIVQLRRDVVQRRSAATGKSGRGKAFD
jgi:hypothetical protein